MIDTKKIVFADGELKFYVGTELELYRVETLLEKEPETIAWISDWSKKSNELIFFDIGANIGIFSLFASHKSMSTKVFCFEPVSDNFAALVRNIKLNNFNNIFPFNLGLGRDSKLTSLFLNDLRVGNSGAQLNRALNDKGELFPPARVETVLSFTLDSLINEFGFPVPDYVKIDVDGLEHWILQGMIKTLANDKLKSILVEFNNIQELNAWKKTLKSLGFKLDSNFDNVYGHSRFRRMKNNSSAINCIFSRYG